MRHVVLEFDDNEAAEEFVKRVTALGGDVEQTLDELQFSWPKETMAVGALIGSKARVVRVFAYPTKTCTCDNGQSHHGNIAFGKKYGWMIHRGCGKPTTTWLNGAKLKYRTVDGWQNVAHSATNLLDDIITKETDNQPV